MQFIGILYSTVPLVVAFGYIPQILRIVKSRTQARDISVTAWMLWLYTSVASLLYSTLISVDIKPIIAHSTNVFFIVVILAVTIYKRFKYKTVNLPNDMVVITEDPDNNPFNM